MPAFYLDASAIVKHYLPEAGSDVVSELLTAPPVADQFHTSVLSTVEVTSALQRQVPAGRLDERSAHEALAAFRATLVAHFSVWPLAEDTVTAAVAVAEQHKLRAGDALHLASALSIAALAPQPSGPALSRAEGLVLVSSDSELLGAAAAAGLVVLDPAAPGAGAILRQLRA